MKKYSLNKMMLVIFLFVLASIISYPYSYSAEDNLTLIEFQEKIGQLTAQKDQMVIDGFNTARLNDNILSAQNYLNLNNLNMAKSSIADAELIIDYTLFSRNELLASKQKLKLAEDNGLDIVNAKNYYDTAYSNYLVENYENTIYYLNLTASGLAGSYALHYGDIKETIDAFLKKEQLLGIINGFSTEFSIQFSMMRDNLDFDGIESIRRDMGAYNNSLLTIFKIKETITSFKGQGLNYFLFDDLLSSSDLALKRRDFDGFNGILLNYYVYMGAYNDTQKYLILIEEKIDKLDMKGVDVFVYDEAYNVILKEKDNENYLKTKELSRELYDNIESAEQKNIVFGILNDGFSIKGWFLRNLYAIIISFIILMISGVVCYKLFESKINLLKIKRYRQKAKILTELVADTQNKYFNEKIISKESYNNLVDKYQGKIVILTEMIDVLKSRK